MKQLKKTLRPGWSFRVLCRDTFFLFTKIWHDQVGICHIFVGRMVGEIQISRFSIFELDAFFPSICLTNKNCFKFPHHWAQKNRFMKDSSLVCLTTIYGFHIMSIFFKRCWRQICDLFVQWHGHVQFQIGHYGILIIPSYVIEVRPSAISNAPDSEFCRKIIVDRQQLNNKHVRSIDECFPTIRCQILY